MEVGAKFPRRGSVWLVNLDPTIGAEIRKVRPAVVISNDVNNQYSDIITVVPITSSAGKLYPFEVSIPKGTGGLEKNSKAKANHIRTIDKVRLIKLLGFLPDELLEELERAIKVHLDINS